MDNNLSLRNINLGDAKNINMDKASLLIGFNKYRSFILPLGVILVSVAILFFVLIPQINQYLNTRNQLKMETTKLNVLRNNFNFLSNLNEAQSESDLQVLTKTLPTGKDFLGIMTAVSDASSKVGITIDTFKFSLGNISKITNPLNTPYPTIQMDLRTIGDARILTSFINELYKTAPLSGIYSIKEQDNKAIILLYFYYKPLPPENISDEHSVSALSAGDQKLLGNIYAFGNLPVQNGVFVEESASSSAITTPVATSSAFSPF